MSVTRRFVTASSFARLIRKQCGSSRIIEGHFPARAERSSHVRVEAGAAWLVLSEHARGQPPVEHETALPLPHVEPLLELCAGKVLFDRCRIRLHADCEAILDRFLPAGSLDVISVAFADAEQAAGFRPPPWFGCEVTNDHAYATRMIATAGRPDALEPPFSNAALEVLLDALERCGKGAQDGEQPARNDPTDMRRHLAAQPVPAARAEPALPTKFEISSHDALFADDGDARPKAPPTDPEPADGRRQSDSNGILPLPRRPSARSGSAPGSPAARTF
jgi:CYTH domain-containing protein